MFWSISSFGRWIKIWYCCRKKQENSNLPLAESNETMNNEPSVQFTQKLNVNYFSMHFSNKLLPQKTSILNPEMFVEYDFLIPI